MCVHCWRNERWRRPKKTKKIRTGEMNLGEVMHPRERSERSSGDRRASATHVSADEYDLLGPGRKAAALLVCSKTRPSTQIKGLPRAAQWNRARVPGGGWQFKSASAPTASQHDHFRCIPTPHAFDSEGIRTPAGRAQWISSPSP